MPRKRNNPEPPPVMTWTTAMPVLAAAAVFDLIRFFFVMFWFFGPALAGLYCASKLSDWIGYLWGLTAALCANVAIAAGVVGSAFSIPFGTVMADAVGLMAFLVLGFWVVTTNARLFTVNKSAWLWLTGSLGVSIIPFIGALPSFFVVLRVLYRRQIKVETAAYARWKKENEDAQREERQQKEARLMQARAAQLATTDVY